MPRPELQDRPHRNHGLFSDHYLDATLPERPEWRELAGEARPVMEEVSSILASYTPSDNEAQTERDLVRPVLALLGHDFPFAHHVHVIRHPVRYTYNSTPLT